MMKKTLLLLYLSITMAFFVQVNQGYAVQGDFAERVFISGYGEVTVVDPTVPKVVASLKIKGPARDMSFTKDGKKALLLGNGRTTFYLVDTLQNKIVDEISLTGRTDSGLLDRRVWGSTISPDGSKIYAFVTQGEKRMNIFKSLPSKLLEIDVKTKEVLRSVEAPYGIHVMQFKPDDPNTIFVWGYDLYKLDVPSLKLELKQGIKHPEKPEDGTGNFLMIWPRDRESGFNSAPLIKVYPDQRVTEGIMWFNLKTEQLKNVEFNKDPVGMFSAVVDPQERYGYVVLNHWYKVDLKNGHVLKDSRPPTGSTYSINISADGKKLYLGGGGNDFIVANTDLKVEKVIKVPTDGWDMRVVKISK